MSGPTGHIQRVVFHPNTGLPFYFCEKCSANDTNGELALPCPFDSASLAPSTSTSMTSTTNATSVWETFWRNLPLVNISPVLTHGKSEFETGKLFTCTNGAYILADAELGRTMYLRPSFTNMYKKLKQLVGSGVKGLRVLGTPGVGKTQWLCPLLYWLRKDYPAAVFVMRSWKRPAPKCVAFYPNGESKGASDLGAFQKEYQNPANFVIFDQGGKGCPEPECEGYAAVKIVISSLDPIHLGAFAKKYPVSMVMPAWAKWEIDEARQHIYNHSQFNDYAALYRDLGGIPRWVFRLSTHAKAVKEFNCTLPDVEQIKQILRTTDLTEVQVPNGALLFTFEVDDDFQVKRVRWVSDRVGEWVMEKFLNGKESDAMDLLATISSQPAFECAFETWAHLMIAQGGTFTARPLTGGACSRLKLAASQTLWLDERKQVLNNVSMLYSTAHVGTLTHEQFELNVSRLTALCCGDQTYGCSHSSQKETDSSYRSSLVFHLAVSQNKDVKVKRLIECANGMIRTRNHALSFVVVVPSMVFDQFTVRLHNEDGNLATAWPACVKDQWVLEIPIAPFKRAH